MWSKTRKTLYDRLAPALRDRVKYELEFVRSGFKGEMAPTSRCRCIFCSFYRFFAVVVDGKRIMVSNNHVYYKSKVSATDRKKEKPQTGIYEMSDVVEAMHLYLNVCSIKECLESGNFLLLLFAILDRRIGKRWIKAVYEKIGEYPSWLWTFIWLRVEAEGVLHQKEEKYHGKEV